MVDERGKASAPVRVEHERAAFRRYLHGLQPGTSVAVEATGSWYWLVDELEEAGLVPHLAQPFAAKRMLGAGSKDSTGGDEGPAQSHAQPQPAPAVHSDCKPPPHGSSSTSDTRAA